MEYLAETDDEGSIPFLRSTMEDEIEIISQAAMSGLEKLSNSADIQKLRAQKSTILEG